MNYTSLIASIKDYSKRKNIPDATIDNFIETALSRANWALRIPPFEALANTVVSSEGYVDVPSNFIEMKELSVDYNGFRRVLDRKAINEVDSLANYNSEGAGCPEIFGRAANSFRIAPWSGDGTEVVSMYYYSAQAPLSASNPTNWLTDFAPMVLLYGSLSELCKYTRDTEGEAMWGANFDREVNILQAVEDKATWSGSSLAVTPTGSIKERNV